MKDQTAAWLDPMLVESHLAASDFRRLIAQASMPAAEAGTPWLNWLAKNTPSGAIAKGVDWIRFGQLLRDELGWQHYPDLPDPT